MTRRYFRRLARKLGVSVLALACLALPAPITAIADQDSGTGTNSDAISEPTYDEMKNGKVGPVSTLTPPISVPNTAGMTIDSLYTHLYGNKYLGTTSTGQTDKSTADTTRRTSVVTDLAITLAAGNYSGQKLTVTLPQLKNTADADQVFTLAPNLSARILGSDGTVFATCEAKDTKSLECTFGSSGSTVSLTQPAYAVLNIQYTPIHNLDAEDRNSDKMTPWDFNGSASSSSLTSPQENALFEQTPTVGDTKRYGYEFDSDISTGAVKQGNVTASDYGANTNTVRWDIYLSHGKLFNGDKTAVIYENAGSPSETVNADGTLKNPKDIQNVDLDYRLRYYPSAEDFTPKVRWTTRTGWTMDSWESLTGCIYRTKDSSGNALSANKSGWRVFDLHGTTDTEGTIGNTCTPYSNNASEPDYTVGVQKGGHGFQIWFNPSSAAVQRMKAHDASDFILEAYYETLPLDVTQRYAKDFDPNASTIVLRNTDSQWALYNRFRLTYDDSGVTKGTTQVDSATAGDTAATYTNSPTGVSTRYDWGEDSWNGTTSSRYPQFTQWLPQYWNSGSNPGIKTATMNVNVIDRSLALDYGITSLQSSDLDPSNKKDPTTGGALNDETPLYTDNSAALSAYLIKAYDPTTAHTGYENPAWFQLARVYDSSTVVPLTGNTDEVTTNVGAAGGTTTDAVAPHSGTDGTLSFAALAPGTYRLYPTVAPAGYSIMASHKTAATSTTAAKNTYYYQFVVYSDGTIEDGGLHGWDPDDPSSTADISTAASSVTAVIPYDRISATVHVSSPKKSASLTKPFTLSSNRSSSATTVKLNAAVKFAKSTTAKGNAGYVNCADAPVTTTGIAGVVKKACMAQASVASEDADSDDDESYVTDVPWTGDSIANNATLTADSAYTGNRVLENSASVTNQLLKALSTSDMTARFAVKRNDLVKAPNTSSTPATIGEIHLSLLDKISFSLPVVDAAKVLDTQTDSRTVTNNTVTDSRATTVDQAALTGVTDADSCAKVVFNFTKKNAASTDKGTDITGTYVSSTGQCVIKGKLPIGTYTVTEKKAPTGYATTTKFTVALGVHDVNTDNPSSSSDAWVTMTSKQVAEKSTANATSIPVRIPNKDEGTNVLPLQRLTATVYIYLRDKDTRKAMDKKGYGSKIRVTDPGSFRALNNAGDIDHNVEFEFGNGGVSTWDNIPSAGYAYDNSKRCATTSGNEDQLCLSNLTWNTQPRTIYNLKAADGYTLYDATADSVPRDGQTGSDLVTGLLGNATAEDAVKADNADKNGFTFTIDYRQAQASHDAGKGLLTNIYERKLVTSMPMTGAQKAILPIILAILAVIAAVVMAIAQVLRRKVRGTHIRG